MHYRKFSLLMLLVLLLVSVVPLAAQDATECEDGFRPFVDAREVTVCVPDMAERIVSTHDYNSGVQLLSLGAPVIGMVSRGGEFTPDVTQFFDTSELVDIGNYTEPNIERILELQPDLIVTYVFTSGDVAFLEPDVVEQLEAIAPFVTIDAFRPVEEVMTDYQELLGDAATVQLDELQAEFESLMSEIEDVLGDDWSDVTMGFVDFNTSSGSFQAWGPTRLVPLDILTRAGVNWVPVQLEAEEEGGYAGGFSIETIDLFSGDLLLVNTVFTDALNNEIISQFPAIQEDQFINLDVPYAGSHYLNYIALAKLILEDLQAIEEFNVDLVYTDETEMDMEATEEASATVFPLTVEHEVGTTVIEAAPERIVVLEYSYADHLGTLGVVPVGFAVDAPPEYIYAYTSDLGAVEVGTRAEPNLEAILELSPDLIIADLRRHEEIYDQLSLIAPTVVFNSLRGSYDDQLEQFSLIAEMLDMQEEGDEILISYQNTFDATVASTNADAGEFVIGVLWSGGFTAHSDESFMGSFLESLGRTNALEPQEGETQFLLDMEGFASVNPSTIVILCNASDQEFLDDLSDGELWQAFDAVTNDRVYAFDRNLWSKGRGITAYELILTDSVNSGLLADTAGEGSVCGGGAP